MTKALQFKICVFRKLKGSLLLKHFAGWTIFIIYEVSFIRFSTGTFSPMENYICYYGLNILLFYFNAHCLLSFAVKLKRCYLLISILLIFELIIYLLLKYALDGFLAFTPNSITSKMAYIKKLLLPNAYRGIYLLGFSTLYWSILRVIMFQNLVHVTEKAQLITLKEKAELERNLAEALNAYLRQQINPHILFNTLTFIHNTYYKYSREASQCVLLLVEILRFSLEEVNMNGKTTLDKEIGQIKNFIELNELRFDYKLYLDFRTEGDLESNQIIPLILLTLTENIFKHGNLKSREKKAKLHILVNDQKQLKVISWNLKSHQIERKRNKSIGIKNVIKRLDYSYKDRYSLAIKNEENSYGLELRVQL